MTYREFLKDYEFEETLTSDQLFFCSIKHFEKKFEKLDLDVYLPSIGLNLQREYVWGLQQ